MFFSVANFQSYRRELSRVMSYCGADKEPDWRNTSVIMTLDTPLLKKWSNGIPFEQQKLVISKTSRDILLFLTALTSNNFERKDL